MAGSREGLALATSRPCDRVSQSRELSPRWLALALGIGCGAGFALLGGLASTRGYGLRAVEALDSVYPGLARRRAGAVLGGLWGFLDGALGGLVVVWLYNRLR